MHKNHLLFVNEIYFITSISLITWLKFESLIQLVRNYTIITGQTLAAASQEGEKTEAGFRKNKCVNILLPSRIHALFCFYFLWTYVKLILIVVIFLPIFSNIIQPLIEAIFESKKLWNTIFHIPEAGRCTERSTMYLSREATHWALLSSISSILY